MRCTRLMVVPFVALSVRSAGLAAGLAANPEAPAELVKHAVEVLSRSEATADDDDQTEKSRGFLRLKLKLELKLPQQANEALEQTRAQLHSLVLDRDGCVERLQDELTSSETQAASALQMQHELVCSLESRLRESGERPHWLSRTD